MRCNFKCWIHSILLLVLVKLRNNKFSCLNMFTIINILTHSLTLEITRTGFIYLFFSVTLMVVGSQQIKKCLIGKMQLVKFFLFGTLEFLIAQKSSLSSSFVVKLILLFIYTYGVWNPFENCVELRRDSSSLCDCMLYDWDSTFFSFSVGSIDGSYRGE